MHPTHAVAPCLMLAGHLPEKVYARGSGKVRRELEEPYGCPYAFEAAFITLQDSDITIEMERFYTELPEVILSVSVYMGRIKL